MTNVVRVVSIAAALALAACAALQQQKAQPVRTDEGEFKNLKVLPQNITHDELITTMRGFARSLGTRCDHCHVPIPGQQNKFDFASDAKPEKILCRTFTKAAAAEMQGRLFGQWGEWAMLPDEDLRARIIGIGGNAHTPLPKARRLFAGALETPGGLKVLTLHAFCQIVLSRFPIEANIPPAFEVLDDQSARELIGAARQRVLERAGSGDTALQGFDIDRDIG